MLLRELAELSVRIAATPKRGEKTALLAECLARALPDQRGLAALYLSGQLRQRKLGVGQAQLSSLRDGPPAAAPSLTLRDVDAQLAAVSEVRGQGSSTQRAALMRALFSRATELEQGYLVRLVLGELRQGALESLMVDAIAKAASVPASDVRRAQMLAADLELLTEAAFEPGGAGLKRFDISLFRPVQPMLAEPAQDVHDALCQLGTAVLEHKLDGARVQVHKRDHEVRVYTRSLNDVTSSVPELVELMASLTARELILDGEVIALREDSRPLPFQQTMRRFGRKLDVHALRATLPLSTFFFDCLFLDGQSLLDATTAERHQALKQATPEHARVPRIVTDTEPEAEAFFQNALASGHEGIMAKALDAPYVAGSRGASWLKLKQAHTLDLVVLAAEWGSGRRKGFLSNLHLGARGTEPGEFVMLGKTFKGLTDALLRFQTDALLARETHRDAYTVYVRPELVVEVAFNEVQTSPQYPGGVALRFARVRRYRPDKTASEADTIQTVRTLHARHHHPE